MREIKTFDFASYRTNTTLPFNPKKAEIICHLLVFKSFLQIIIRDVDPSSNATVQLRLTACEIEGHAVCVNNDTFRQIQGGRWSFCCRKNETQIFTFHLFICNLCQFFYFTLHKRVLKHFLKTQLWILKKNRF